MLITLSGLDGAGKTTLARKTKGILEKHNKRVTVLTMYDDISLYSFFRKIRSFVFGSQKQKPKNNSPVSSIARNVLVRQFVYPIDAAIFFLRMLYECRVKGNVLIMDRYFYDSLADIFNSNRCGLFRIGLFLLITPTPEIPIFVDVDAIEAFKRKREYSVSLLNEKRKIYQKIFKLVKKSVAIKNYHRGKTLQALNKIILHRMGTR